MGIDFPSVEFPLVVPQWLAQAIREDTDPRLDSTRAMIEAGSIVETVWPPYDPVPEMERDKILGRFAEVLDPLGEPAGA